MARTKPITLNPDDIKANLRALYNRATDEQMDEGLAWYDAAFVTVTGIATLAGVTIDAAAAVVAAISPRQTWSRNVKIALSICQYPNGVDHAVFAINLEKSRRILAGEEPLKVLGGNKVRAFYANLLGQYDDVTVDGWIWRGATNGDYNHRITDNQYALISRCIRELAAEAGDITPAQYQAVVWCVLRGNGR